MRAVLPAMRTSVTVCVTALATLILLTATSAHATVLRYRGKAWSDLHPGVLQMRLVLVPSVEPAAWGGTIRCRRLSGRGSCLARSAPVHIQFTADGRFSGSMGGTLCRAGGLGTPTTALDGSYRCTNGDSGWFYFRRLGR